MTPLESSILASGSQLWELMSIALFGCLLLAAAFIRRSAIGAKLARSRNETLVCRLDEARKQAEELNQQLISAIDQRRQAEQARLAATVFEATSDGIFILDPSLKILAVNQAFSVITGYAARDVMGMSITSLSRNPETQAIYARLHSALRSQDRWEGEMIEQRRSGERYPQWLQLTVVRDEQGAITHYVGFFADRTTSRQTEAQLRYLTNYDPLTQLANRSLFIRELSEATGAARLNGHSLALLHIDLDRFKYINDTLGHVLADALLRRVASRLSDLLPDAFVLARLSADEFVLIEQGMDQSQLAELAEKLLAGLGKSMVIEDNELTVTASIGISRFLQPARNSLQMINQANQAMQHAKHLGGNNFQFYSADLPSFNLNHLQLENQLRKAIAEDQLLVHYQPKLHLASDRISSAEALVRWEHPEHGLLLPRASSWPASWPFYASRVATMCRVT